MVQGKIIGGKRVKFSLMVMLCFTIIVSLLGPLMDAAQVYAAAGFSGGDGTVGNPYIVTTPEQLDAIRNNLGANYKLGNNIDLTAYLAQDGGGYNDGKFWRPIAESAFQMFNGTFDGDGYVIRGLKINSDASQNNVGFFGTASMGATIKNIGLENVVVTSGSFVGGLVGVLRGPSTTISNSYVTGSVSGANYIGGLVGYQSDSSISNSYSSVKVTGYYAGGLVGYKDTSSVSTSYATGLVSGPYAGGLVGASPTGTVTDSFYDKSTTGGYDSGKGTPKTTLEMQTQSTFGSEWDFATVWYMPLNQYPQLRKFMTNTPVANPDPSGGSVALGSVVTLTSGTAGASIYYTTNGDTPTTSSTLYSSPIILDDDLTIKAIAIVTGKSDSEIMSKSYTITRAVAPTTGTLEMGTDSETTKLNGVTDAMEYKVNSGVYKAITDTSVDNISVNAGDKIYVRIAATSQQPVASSAQELTVDLEDIKPAEAPSGTLTPGSDIGTTKLCGVTNAMEYSLDGEDYTWITTEPYADNISVNAGDTIYVRVAATVQQPASDVQELTVVQADIKQETTPIMLSLTPGTNIGTTKLIGVTDVMEYKVNNDEYTKINDTTVDNISVTTGDTIYVRIAATLEEPASEEHELIVDQADIKPADAMSATLTSTIGKVSTGGTANETITNIPNGTTLAKLKAAITPAANATFEVYDEDGTTVATTLVTGSKVIVTAEDGITTVTYTVTVNAAVPVPPVDGGNGNGSGSGGGGGGGGSTTPPPPSDNKVTSTDGKLTLPSGKTGEVSLGDAVTISIPAGATDKEMKLTIEKLLDTQKLLTNKEIPASAIYELLKDFPENFNKPVRLSFVFDPAKLEANQAVAVFYYDETKKAWVKVEGGKTNGNRIAVEVNHFTKYAVLVVDQATGLLVLDQPTVSTTEMNLSDILGHWAEANIKQAISSGIVAGYPDGTFRPNHTVTRAEFAVMLMHTLKPQEVGTSLTFTDTAKIGAWAKTAVAQAVQAGLIKGYEDGTFRPDAEITRAEMAVILASALGHSTEANTAIGFADDKDIPAWAKNSVAIVKQSGMVQGKNNNLFVPQDHATRAEAVTVLLNMLELTSK